MSKSKLPIKDYSKLSKGEAMEAFGFDPWLLEDLAEISDDGEIVYIDFASYPSIEIPRTTLDGAVPKKIYAEVKKTIKDNYMQNIDSNILRAQMEAKRLEKFKEALKKW